MKFFLVFLICFISAWACDVDMTCELCQSEQCFFIERKSHEFVCVENLQGTFTRIILNCTDAKPTITTSTTEKTLTHEEWLQKVFLESEIRKKEAPRHPSIEETTPGIPLSTSNIPKHTPLSFSPGVKERVSVAGSSETLSDRILTDLHEVAPPPNSIEETSTDIPLLTSNIPTHIPLSFSPHVEERLSQPNKTKLSERILSAINKNFPEAKRHSGLYIRLVRNLCHQLRFFGRMKGNKKVGKYFMSRNPWANSPDLCEKIIKEQKIRRGYIQ